MLAALLSCSESKTDSSFDVVGKTGKIIPEPGTIEELQKYLELKPDGSFAASAKELIAGLGGTVNTTFQNPNAPAPGKKKK